MPFQGKVVLFVEGEFNPRPRREESLSTIWSNHLVNSLSLKEIDRIVPINKKNITVMDPDAPKSGTGNIPLDKLIWRELDRTDFDIAVVAWDLQPPWDPHAQACRWNETILLYDGLSTSDVLPNLWKERAKSRKKELVEAFKTKKPTAPPKLEKGLVLAVCMEPIFESLLLCCERAIRDALGVKNGGRVNWPKWEASCAQPDDLLQQAIEASHRVKPKPRALKIIFGDMITAKNEWGEFFLRNIINDPQCLIALKSHPIARRLVRLLEKKR